MGSLEALSQRLGYPFLVFFISAGCLLASIYILRDKRCSYFAFSSRNMRSRASFETSAMLRAGCSSAQAFNRAGSSACHSKQERCREERERGL
jgi:hypothetical protein